MGRLEASAVGMKQLADVLSLTLVTPDSICGQLCGSRGTGGLPLRMEQPGAVQGHSDLTERPGHLLLNTVLGSSMQL